MVIIRKTPPALIGRREMLLKSAGLFAFAGLSRGPLATAFGQNATTVIATPVETEGPYWVDEMLNRSDLTNDC